MIRCLLEGPEGKGDTTSLVLFFQNRTEEDVLLRDVLDGASLPCSGALSEPQQAFVGAAVESTS